MKIHQIVRGLLVIATLAALPVLAKAQSLLDSGDSSGAVAITTPAQLRPDVYASDRDNEDPQLPLRRVRPVSHRRRRAQRRALTKPGMHLRTGGEAQSVTASDSGPTSA